MSQRFGSGGGAELRNQRYLNKLQNKFGSEISRQIFDDLMWQNDPASPTTIIENVSRLPAASRPAVAKHRHSPFRAFASL